jgi:hypothetical protein
MALPNLIYAKPTAGFTTAGVTLAVYAPFGTDAVLSSYPGTSKLTIQQHPLVANLVGVAKAGVHVSALIDLFEDDTWLVEIPAGKPSEVTITSRWKHQMDAINNLSGFLRHTRKKRPGTALVLALEGHGAGYLPEIDISQLTTANLTQDGSIEWQITDGQGAPLLPMGSPLLPMGSPLLPMGSPLLPVNHMPLSTWGLAQALKLALSSGPPPLGVIHFNNCFNMSVELLHTVAPYAEFATGYMNYNFFTAGGAYPFVFNKLKVAGSATTAQLAKWFAEANRDVLAGKTHHPTVGGVVALKRMNTIATRVDALANALTTALTSASTAARPGVVTKIRTAIGKAQQYDSVTPMVLDTPDELTDLCSFAAQFTSFDVNAVAVQKAAKDLVSALAGIKVYGANDTPWTEPAVTWNFTSRALAMNILCPDPALRGLWDWRSPFYLQTVPDPAKPPVQPQVIDFLKNTGWVRFIIEYHRDVAFKGILPAAIPDFPPYTGKITPPTTGATGTTGASGPGRKRPTTSGNAAVKKVAGKAASKAASKVAKKVAKKTAKKAPLRPR